MVKISDEKKIAAIESWLSDMRKIILDMESALVTLKSQGIAGGLK